MTAMHPTTSYVCLFQSISYSAILYRRRFVSSAFAIAIFHITAMTRYNNTHLDTSSQSQDNLSIVRGGLTAKPQNTLADFRLRPTPYGLELQLAEKRIRDRLVFKQQKDAADMPSGLSIRSALATVTLVGGAVALTSSAIFGAVIAGILPMLYKVAKPAPKESKAHSATLRFVNTPNGRTLLSMTTMPESHNKLSHHKRYSPSPPDSGGEVHFSNLPVRLVSANTYLFGGQLSVTLYERDRNGRNKLRITGSQQEIRWLHDRISKWNNQPSA